MSNQILIDEMTKEQMERWLFGDDQSAIDWRTEPQNQGHVGALVNRYAETPGGMSVTNTSQRLAAEKERLAAKREAQKVEDDRSNMLKEVARTHFTRGGMPSEYFEAKWDELKESLVTSGRATELMDRAERERRQKAPRTF